MNRPDRWRRLLELIRDTYCDGNQAQLARRIGKDGSYVNRLFWHPEKNGAKGIGPEVIEACGQAFNLPVGFWDMAPEHAEMALKDMQAATGVGMSYWGRLKIELDARGWDLHRAAGFSNVDAQELAKLQEGGALSAGDNIRMSKALGVNPAWLANAAGKKYDLSSPSAMPPPALHAIQVATSITPSPAPSENAIQVPLLANAGSMGQGTDVQHDDVIMGTIALSPEWIVKRVRPTAPQALRFIHAYGDSMAPTFEDGDVLLVDTGARDPAIDGVYVLEAHRRIFIKRVRQRLDGSYEVSSDNPNVKTVDVLNGDHAVDVLGRVVWAWNGKKM